MYAISKKIKENFRALAIYKNAEIDNLFSGSGLPLYVKDYIVKRFSDNRNAYFSI